jgi:hypothetical protein
MNMQRLKNEWKYHYKKIIALTCTILALVCLIGSGAYSLYLSYLSRQSGSTISLYLSIYDFALFAIAYMLILIGNLQGTTLAYQGMLMYVFITLFSAVLAFFENGFLNFDIFWSGNLLAIILFLLVLAFDVLIIVTGIMTYVRTAQYLRNSYTNYIGLKVWCLLFAIFNTLLYGAEPTLLAINGSGISTLLLVLEPLSQVFIGWAIFFTITRLKTEY